MINTKFVFGVSMVAIMAVGVAHADIAATTYFKGSAPITVDKGTISVAVDSALSSSSTNPVENRVVYNALSGKQAKLTTTNVTTTGTGNVVTAVSASDGKVTVTKGASLPTVNNATLTIQKNGSTVDTFTANASANKTINIEVPTTVAGLTDAGNYATKAYIDGELGTLNDNNSDLMSRVGTLEATTQALDEDKQNMLTATNVTTTGEGNVVTAVSASEGKVTVTKGASLPTVNNATLTIKNGATNGNLATFTANSSAPATATIPAASATVAGLAKIGVIPSGSATSATYASIWVE